MNRTTTIQMRPAKLFLPWALLLPALCTAQSSIVTLDFEGLQGTEPILNFYNGGLGGKSSGPGPNYGITFGADSLTLISQAQGGSGNFDLNPSGKSVVFFNSGSGVVMNVTAGFSTGFSFYYAAAFSAGTVTVYDGANATGGVLATLALPVTGAKCNGSQYDFSCWSAKGVAFTGTAKSVSFAGAVNQIGFDNITLGASTPNNLILSSTPLPAGLINTAYQSTQLQATGGSGVYAWSATGLPPGLTLNSTTGILSGTPTVAGTYTASITAVDGSPARNSGTQTYTIVIAAPLSISSTCPGSAVISAAFPSTAFTAQGGSGSYSWTGGNLPGGLNLSSTGVLSGTPNATGNFNSIFTVTDTSSPVQTVTKACTIVITPPAATLSLTTSTLFSGVVGVPYTATTLTASGGTGAYKWTANNLPTGLALNPTSGVLSGTPTTAGAYDSIITVSDSAIQPQTATKTFRIAITPPPLFFTPVTIPTTGAVGTAYPSTTLTAQGGNGNYSWSSSGLPPGLALSTTAGATTVLSGTPTSAGTFNSVAITISDTATPPSPTTVIYTLTISPAPIPVTITPGTITNNQAPLSLTLGAPSATPLTGQIDLTFVPDAAVKGIAGVANYRDKTAVFSNGTATFGPFTIPAGCTAVPSACPIANWAADSTFGQGTVAGKILLTLTKLTSGSTSLLPGTPQQTVISLPPAAPVIRSVNLINITSTGFVVDIKGVSNTRELTVATFTFSAAPGTQLGGTGTPIPVALNGADQSLWFNTAAGRDAGGNFHLQVPFALTGDPAALGTVSVTLAGGGFTSTAVSGGR